MTLREDIKARNIAYTTMNVEYFRQKIRESGHMISSDHALMASIHKARYECTDIPDSFRHDSRKWLEQNGIQRYRGAPWPPEGVLEK